MSINNWYAFYVGDYMRDTAHLSMIEHGAYRVLLDHYYATAEPLPDDVKQLYRICRAFDDQEQKAIQSVLQMFFTHDNQAGLYRSKRVDLELEKKCDISRKRSEAAKNKGNATKANAKQLQIKSKAIDDTSTSTSTSTSINTKTTKIKKEINSLYDYFCSSAKGCNIPAPVKLSKTRIAALNARLKEYPEEKIKEAIDKACASDFCNGNNNNGWVLDFDFFLKPDSIPKILEGKYDNKTKPVQKQPALLSIEEAFKVTGSKL